VRLFVAALLLVAIGVAAKIAFEHVAPEGLASASGGLARAETEAPDTIASVKLVGPGLRAFPLAGAVTTPAGDKLSEADLAADGAAVVSALHASGHLDAAVGSHAITRTAAGADIELPVDPGAIYTVRNVRWTGRRARANLAKLPVIATGDALDTAHLSSTATLVEGWLAQRKVHATVTWDVTVDRAAKLADVTFTVE